MKELSIETINNQFVEFWGNMIDAGLDRMYNPDALKQILSVSAASCKEDSGSAYPGALLVHINLVVGLAKRTASMVSGSCPINLQSLVKVCILQNLSKSSMLVQNDNQWEVANRGLNYKFTELEGRIKSGSRSLYYAVVNGVQFTPIEWEAMESIDKDTEDLSARFFDNPMTIVVRQANELAAMIERERYKKENNK